jgi:hypothetical protein
MNIQRLLCVKSQVLVEYQQDKSKEKKWNRGGMMLGTFTILPVEMPFLCCASKLTCAEIGFSA